MNRRTKLHKEDKFFVHLDVSLNRHCKETETTEELEMIIIRSNSFVISVLYGFQCSLLFDIFGQISEQLELRISKTEHRALIF